MSDLIRRNVCGCLLPNEVDCHVCNVYCVPPLHATLVYADESVDDMAALQEEVTTYLHQCGACEHFRAVTVHSARPALEVPTVQTVLPRLVAEWVTEPETFRHAYLVTFTLGGVRY